ncbi:hypothetical protein HYT53_03580 [Candidatus Woesearchaeota archaeon]|nr:hypothetical protein [Candidatus Woesearchaeota archaeon]
MKNHKNSEKIAITAIIGIIVLESLAIWKGINGVLFGTALTFIAGIAGYTIKK